MAKNGCRIGGEQSGHIIFSKYASTGDGILTSLKMMEVMLAKKLPMSKLAEPLKIYPQVLENVRVTDKKAAQDDEAVQAAVKAVAEALGDTGRILVRESGTEPVVRVMVESSRPRYLPEICVSGRGDYQEQRLRSLSANLKRGCGILLIASVVLLSILALLPDADVDHDAGYTASELSIRETVDGSVTSTSYVNPGGVITDAIDMGYATVCRMRDDNGRVVEERYLDANGEPVARYGDYYGLSYEYDETSTIITYLDAEGNPIILSDGYSTIVRTQVGGRAPMISTTI